MRVPRLSVFALICWLGTTSGAAEHSAAPAQLSLVRAVVAAELHIKVADVIDSATLARQIKPADSLNFVEIVLALERRTGRTISDEAMNAVIGDFSMKDIAERITVKQLADVLANSKE
jgi:acyl carrier protein